MWKTVKLGEVAKALGGSGFPKKYQGKSSGEFPFFKVSDMNSIGNEMLMVHSTNYVSTEDLKCMKAKHYPAGTIIFPKIGGAISTNKKRLLTCDSAFDNNVMGVVPTQGVIPEYLYKVFLGLDLYELSNKAALPSITKGSVEGVEIALPSLPVQKQIVEKLDAAFADIDKAHVATQKNIENAEALFYQSLDELLLTKNKQWESESLKNITLKIGSGATPRGGKSSYKDTGIPLIRSMNIHDLRFKHKDLAFIDDEQASKLDNVRVIPKDVLFNITGASIARCTCVPNEIIDARVNQHVMIIRPEAEKLHPDFLQYLLVSPSYKKLLLQTGEASGATRQAITKTDIENLLVEYPKDISEQQTMVNQIKELRRNTLNLKDSSIKKEILLTRLKFSILNQAFSGELTKDAA